MIIAFTIAALLICLSYCFISDIFADKKDYKYYLSREVKFCMETKTRFVWLDFESFKSIIPLSPESWRICGCYIKTLRLVHPDTGDECYILFKKRRDRDRAIKLFRKYQEEEDRKNASKKEIENFSFFKKMVQFDIDRKKKEAEKEIEEANRLLKNLNEG